MSRAYDALVLDIDGTLLDDEEQLSRRTASAIANARRAGVKVMLATGRSHDGVREVARRLALDLPSVVLNGAAVYCHRTDKLLERYLLPSALVESLINHARERDLLPVVASEHGQFAREARAHEAELLAGFTHLTQVHESQLPRSPALRMTLFSLQHQASEALHAEILAVAGADRAYCTHFALSALAGFRDSAAQVVDVQPECEGKAEALRLLRDQHGIPAERVVAVGDAGNDLPILSAVGLGVAMGNATPDVKRVAKRVIGTNNSDALAELIETLFL
jgi:Cof subfamily protein (haloacid dehalogenase superfamily)